jgi:hypothetical protein
VTEDDVSREMYLAAVAAADLEVLSWQGVGGKSYFTYEISFRVGLKRMLPDLVLLHGAALWIIEIKGTHTESAVEDESKLQLLRSSMDDATIVQQVRLCVPALKRSDILPRFAVAFGSGSRLASCPPQIEHLPWSLHRPRISAMLDSCA